MFELPAALLSWFYGLTHSYGVSIALVAIVIMAVITPLNLKSTKGMLEMQRLAPELRRLQQQHRNDRTKLNEETMKLYQEHKVNPMSSCLPLFAQMPIFIIMFRILHGLTYRPRRSAGPLTQAVLSAAGDARTRVGFLPRYIDHSSDLYQSLVGKFEMRSFGLDLAKSPAQALQDNLGTGLVYALLVVALGGLYYLQQRMVAARAMVSPTMSPTQQKLMQYLPVAFAIFQVFFVTGLVIYYAAQAVLRIGQQAYITRRFYGHEEALGRQAQRAGERARELAKQHDDGDGGSGGGFFAQARRELAAGRGDAGGGKQADASSRSRPSAARAAEPRPAGPSSKRTTAPKGRPTPSGRPGGPPGRPGGQRKSGRKRR